MISLFSFFQKFYAHFLNARGVDQWRKGNYTKAEALYQRTLKINERVLGLEHPNTGVSLNNLAALYRAMGDYAKADPLFQRALRICEKVLGPEHLDTAQSLNSLAVLYQAMGDYAKAEPLFQRALKIQDKVLGPEHPDTAESLGNLAALYQTMGEYAKAEPPFQRALKIQDKVLGPEHPDTARSLNNLAVLYRTMGDYAKAELLFQGALKILEKVLGPEHPNTAQSLNNLAVLYWITGDYPKAEVLVQRGLQILEKTLGPEHPTTANTKNTLGHLLADLGRLSEAVQLAQQAHRAHVSLWANLLSFTSESQRLAFQAKQRPYDLFGTQGSAPNLAAAVLQFKGLVLDSLLEDRLVAQASDQSETRALVDQLRLLKHRLPQLIIETPTDLSEAARQRREEEKKRLTQEAEQMESTLARHVAGLGRARRALSVTVEQVQAAIPKDEVLLEWLRYGHYLGKNQWEIRYGVIVLASSGEPQWVSLGSAEAIEKNIEQYRAAMRGVVGDSPKSEVQSPKSADASPEFEVQGPKPVANANPNSEIISHNSEIEPLLRRLHEQLWAPLEPLLPPGTKTVILSPDGALNFLSFATLLTPDDRFLSQKYSIRYVASGRDLLREFQSSENAQVTVFANPDFGGQSGVGSPEEPTRSANPSSVGTDSTPSLTISDAGRGKEVRDAVERVPTHKLREMEIRDFAALHLPPLPGTARESALLAAQARQWNWPMQVFDQAQASKSQLHAIQSPRILHLATHGFFLADGGAHAPRVPGSAPSPKPSAKPVSEPFSIPVGAAPTGAAGAAALPATDVEGLRGVGGIRPFGNAGFLGESASFLRPHGVLKNPMHRSGLALAGAQATLDAWQRGETPSSGDDGIMTAAEVGTLKLEGTELVVLSACETGAGEAKSGEGVLGLRRGFIQAGAKNLLMTLWSVADEETAQFMAEFYERFHATGNAPQALADVQREWLVRLRRERGLREAVLLAGPFILSSQGTL